MIFTHYTFNEPIVLDDCLIQQLVFENPADMGRMIGELYSQSQGMDGSFAIIDNDVEVPMNKMFICIDPYSLNPNSKEIITGVIKQLFAELNSERFIEEKDLAIITLQQVIAQAAIEIDPNPYVDGLDVKNLIKNMNPHFICDGDLPSNILDVVRLSSQYAAYRLFVLINFSSFLSDYDYSMLIHNLTYLQIPIIMIESKIMTGFTKTRIFDSDYCELSISGDRKTFDV